MRHSVACAKTIHEVIGIVGISECCICQKLNSTNRVKSILIMAQHSGLSTGIVTTTRVTHATPAAAYAHIPHRDWESSPHHSKDKKVLCPDIASQLLTEGIDFNVILGGGYHNFYQTPDAYTPATNGTRTDGRNLLKEWIDKQEMQSRQYQLIFNRTALLKVNNSETNYLLGLFSGSHMDYEIQRRDQPSLAEMTSVAIQILSRNFKGFLLLVEGGRIDHAHHTNMAKAALTDTLAMENAVLTAVRETDPKETLILVTADHSHGYGIAGYATRRQNIFDIDDTQEADDGMPYLISSYFNGPAAKINQTRENPLKPGRLDDLAMQQALVPLSLATHTGEDVALYSTGPMHQLFHGTIDNTFIAYGTMYALCLEPYKNASHCQQSKGTRNAKQQTISIVLQLSTLFWLQMN
ncbi:unnamed protein product [Dicrocoelium dendriticum]|nr:unnamed protein product [Dicrocoelium dendriticum]